MSRTFEELIGRYLDDLYSAALCIMQDEARAEDLVQEAALRAFHGFPEAGADVREPGRFRDWMLRIVVSTCVSRDRRRGRDPLAPAAGPEGQSGPEEALEWRGGLPDPDSSRYDVVGRRLPDAWPRLERGDRIVLWLADVERYRHAEIAEMLGADIDTVRRRHHRARRMLVEHALDRSGGPSGDAAKGA